MFKDTFKTISKTYLHQCKRTGWKCRNGKKNCTKMRDQIFPTKIQIWKPHQCTNFVLVFLVNDVFWQAKMGFGPPRKFPFFSDQSFVDTLNWCLPRII